VDFVGAVGEAQHARLMWLPEDLDLVVAYATIAGYQGETLDLGLGYE
jgi:hypothetical protein